MNFNEPDEHRALRKAVAELGARFGFGYMRDKAKAGQPPSELWQEAAQLGFLGVHLPEEYGGGGAGMYELALVQEELAAAGCSQLMMVVSPTICGTLITRFGTSAQKERWLPSFVNGSRRIFEIACERLGVEPAQAVMIDDLEQNLVGAARIGIRGVLHTDSDTTIRVLDRWFP